MPTEFLRFVVEGVAQPKGNARAYTYTRKAEKGGGIGARVELDTKRGRTWQRLVNQAAWMAMNAARAQVRRGPVAVKATFWLPKPAKLPPERRGEPTTKPDLDKLLRAVLDALTNLVVLDDGQVTELVCRKRYAATLADCRLEVVIEDVLPDIQDPNLPLA